MEIIVTIGVSALICISWVLADIKIEAKRKNTLTEKQNAILEKISESLSKTNNNGTTRN